MGDTGGEPGASFPQKTPLLKQGNAQSNALSGDDERLRLLLEAWAELPESVKTAVLVAWAELPESVKDADRAMPLCKAG